MKVPDAPIEVRVCAHCDHPVGDHRSRGCLVDVGETDRTPSGLCPCLMEYERELNWFLGKTKAVAPTASPERTKVSDTSNEVQVGGDHYRKHKVQVWDIVDEYGLDFFRGNALKYLLRAGSKGPALEDLRKCQHYINKIIEREERK